MNIVKLMVIIIYLTIGSVSGIIIISETANDLGLQNSSFSKNRYVDGIIGSIFMFLIFGVFIRRATNAIKGLEHLIMCRSVVETPFITIGLTIGLFVSIMVSFILGSIGNFISNHSIPVIIMILLCYSGFQSGLEKRDEMLMFLPENIARSMSQCTKGATPKTIDISATIDGRISEVIRCGFIDGNILIPQGVINELQIVASSNGSAKREKGKRGLGILNGLHDLDYPTKVIHPTKTHSDIDMMLLKLVKQYHASIMTTDSNLNKVYHVHGIKALNVNDLSEAIKPNVHQGDQLHILLIKTGKEPGRAVGYLDDGTMVVVDSAKNLIGSHVNLEAVSLLQTSSGRIAFAKKVEDIVSL